MKAFDIALIAFAVGLTAYTLHTFNPPAEASTRAPSGPFTAIVLHDSAHPIPAPDGPGLPPFPWHFMVKRDGTVLTGYLWRDRLAAGHTGLPELDRTSLSICLEGDLDRTPATRAQCRELLRLLERIGKVTKIGPERVMNHDEMNPGKACPGRGLPAEAVREAFRRRVAETKESPTPSSGRRPAATR